MVLDKIKQTLCNFVDYTKLDAKIAKNSVLLNSPFPADKLTPLCEKLNFHMNKMYKYYKEIDEKIELNQVSEIEDSLGLFALESKNFLDGLNILIQKTVSLEKEPNLKNLEETLINSEKKNAKELLNHFKKVYDVKNKKEKIIKLRNKKAHFNIDNLTDCEKDYKIDPDTLKELIFWKNKKINNYLDLANHGFNFLEYSENKKGIEYQLNLLKNYFKNSLKDRTKLILASTFFVCAMGLTGYISKISLNLEDVESVNYNVETPLYSDLSEKILDIKTLEKIKNNKSLKGYNPFNGHYDSDGLVNFFGECYFKIFGDGTTSGQWQEFPDYSPPTYRKFDVVTNSIKNGIQTVKIKEDINLEEICAISRLGEKVVSQLKNMSQSFDYNNYIQSKDEKGEYIISLDEQKNLNEFINLVRKEYSKF